MVEMEPVVENDMDAVKWDINDFSTMYVHVYCNPMLRICD